MLYENNAQLSSKSHLSGAGRLLRLAYTLALISQLTASHEYFLSGEYFQDQTKSILLSAWSGPGGIWRGDNWNNWQPSIIDHFLNVVLLQFSITFYIKCSIANKKFYFELWLDCDSRWKDLIEVRCFSFNSKTEVLSLGFVIIKADALVIIIYTDKAFFWHPIQRPGFEIKV